MPRLLGSLLLLNVIAAFTAFAQAPDYILYDSFFFRVNWFDSVAQQQSARGKDGSSLRSAVRRQAKLTLAEEETLRGVARDYRDTIARLTATRTASPIRSKSDVQPYWNQRKQAALDHVERLRSALGPSSFQKVDRFVRSTVKVRVPQAETKN